MDADAPGRLVIVSGRSGSGKSTALHVLEDAGFYCIDNLPVELLPELMGGWRSAQAEQLQRIAVSIDARNTSTALARFHEVLAALPEGVSRSILFLDADDATLIKRYSETRRKHPLSNSTTSLHEAIAAERELLAPIAAEAALTIDTSQMTLHELRDLVSKTVVADSGAGMVVLFESFGYKRGVPVDADIVFDLRCLPNPHWLAPLRHLTGRDAPVVEFLAAHADVAAMESDIAAWLHNWLPRYASSNRSYITVALGCTGGQHRSVYMCERLFAAFRSRFPAAQVRHREIGP